MQVHKPTAHNFHALVAHLSCMESTSSLFLILDANLRAKRERMPGKGQSSQLLGNWRGINLLWILFFMGERVQVDAKTGKPVLKRIWKEKLVMA